MTHLVIDCGQGWNDHDEVDYKRCGRVSVHLQWSLGYLMAFKVTHSGVSLGNSISIGHSG